LSAHFLRRGDLVLMALTALAPLLLLVKKRTVLLILQCLAYLGVIVWVHTLYVLLRVRMMLGESWVRMVLILSAVALFTFFAGYLLRSDQLKQRYH